jgi:bifunctional non-homologous end joining protein LigD
VAQSSPLEEGVNAEPLRMRVSAFIEPCLPSPADRLPSGSAWIYEIKLDGFRMMVRRDPAGVRLITRNGHDWSGRFPLIAEAAGMLRARSFLIDGEAVACDGDGMPCFDRLRYRRQDGHVFLYAFDLIELNDDDLRRERIERRKMLLIRLLANASVGLQVNDHIVEPGDVVFRHACQLGFEGIVSKRLGSPYHSGRSGPDFTSSHLQISHAVRIRQRQLLVEALATTPFRHQERDFLPQRLSPEIGRLPLTENKRLEERIGKARRSWAFSPSVHMSAENLNAWWGWKGSNLKPDRYEQTSPAAHRANWPRGLKLTCQACSSVERVTGAAKRGSEGAREPPR